MSPFKNKPVKWDGEDEGGRFEEKDGFKFDIVTQGVVKQAETMPEYYLANTPEEADRIYKEYAGILNNMAYSYSVASGIPKTDLFGEALIGLARASRDWDPKRGDFHAHALYKIKDALNECVRSNATAISVPAYIKKAHSNLSEVRNICEAYDIDWRLIVIEQELPDNLIVADAVRCAQLVENMIKAANRAKVEYDKFIERIECLPEDTDYSDEVAPEEHIRRQQQVEAALVVEKLKQHMDEEELAICNGIMSDRTYEQIGEEFGKSKAWVAGKMKALRTRIISMMRAGTL